MATTYKFIVESRGMVNADKVQMTADGSITPLKGAGTKSLGTYTGGNNGVEHNRYMRVFNPVLNRMTGGMWEKGVRLGRAGQGVVSVAQTKGIGEAFKSVGTIIIAQFVIMELFKAYEEQRKKADNENKANFLKIQSGQTMLSKEYKINKNFFGALTYRNQ